ncbi:MAG: hypothetical protein ACKKL4_03075 [Patescibacteria group bacterium]
MVGRDLARLRALVLTVVKAMVVPRLALRIQVLTVVKATVVPRQIRAPLALVAMMPAGVAVAGKVMVPDPHKIALGRESSRPSTPFALAEGVFNYIKYARWINQWIKCGL